jgi:hypothetical protein
MHTHVLAHADMHMQTAPNCPFCDDFVGEKGIHLGKPCFIWKDDNVDLRFFHDGVEPRALPLVPQEMHQTFRVLLHQPRVSAQ